MLPGAATVIGCATKAVEFARGRGFQIIHVGLGFSVGHPEIAASNLRFAAVKQNELFIKGSPSAEFHPCVFRKGDHVIYKQRVSAFCENELHLVLRARQIETLVFFGISTSGITLSTLRHASDLDYRCVVLSDSCFDSDPEVHKVLIEKVFCSQARVLTVDAFMNEQIGV